MNYKLQAQFLNDVSAWRAHIPALITMDIIKSPFLHQCRLHSNVYGFKIVQKSFIQSSSNLQEANHLGFSCQQVSQLKSRRDDEQKIKFVKLEFGVATVVYFGKLWKNQKR